MNYSEIGGCESIKLQLEFKRLHDNRVAIGLIEKNITEEIFKCRDSIAGYRGSGDSDIYRFMIDFYTGMRKETDTKDLTFKTTMDDIESELAKRGLGCILTDDAKIGD